VDHGPSGAPYAAGELIVTYEEEAPINAVESLDEEAGAEVEGDLPAITLASSSSPKLRTRPPGRCARRTSPA
jgi:hypothetical protein